MLVSWEDADELLQNGVLCVKVVKPGALGLCNVIMVISEYQNKAICILDKLSCCWFLEYVEWRDLLAAVESNGNVASFRDLYVGPLSKEADMLQKTLMGKPFKLLPSSC